MQIDDYKIKRVSLGLPDITNDGIADGSGLAQIDPQNYAAIGDVELQRANYGDKIEDIVDAHFQQGNQSNTPMAGYNYNLTPLSGANATMLLYNAKLPYLQLYRTFSYSGSADMNLEIESFRLVISDFTGLNVELDLEVTNPSDIIYWMERGSPPNDENFLFTFNENDLDNQVNYGTYHTAIPNFHYYEDQRYVLTVQYRVCGNFYPALNIPVEDLKSKDVQKEAIITNHMWLSGKKWDLTSPG
ncbi:MAG: hypothetical protein H0U27_00320, partial [Nitrosopumilus sp.]|nr:hypothetical protein [Nitrosopumilus sp.]